MDDAATRHRETPLLERSPLFQLSYARLIEFLRDPHALFWVFAFPVLIAIALGIAFRDDAYAGNVRYIEFLLPGLIGMNIMGSAMWGLGYAIVDTRKRKLLKRYAVTPMNRAHFLLSFFLSRVVFLVAEVLFLLLAGYLIFQVRVVGNLATVLFLSMLGSFSFNGIALLIGARTESTEVASGWMNFVMMPMYMLSGVFFSYDRFPEVLHPFMRLLPLTALNDALRLSVNHGSPLWEMPLELGVMTFWGVAGFILALRFFRWQ